MSCSCCLIPLWGPS